MRASEGATGSFDPGLAVIVVSGRSSEADRLRGLESGADDYIVKPFAVGEVVARIRAVMRRRGEQRSGPLRVGEITVDPSRREVRVAGELIRLANKEFTLLRTLASDPTRVFTKSELLRDVWGFRSLGKTRTLDSHASRLRRKLDPEARPLRRELLGSGVSPDRRGRGG